MAEGFVQVATDGAGKKIDTTELTRADGTVAERQRVNIAGSSDPRRVMDLNLDGSLPVDFSALLFEMKRQTALLTAIALTLGADLADNLLQD